MGRKPKGDKPMTSGERTQLKNNRYEWSKESLAKFVAFFRIKEVRKGIPKPYRDKFNDIFTDNDWDIVDFIDQECKLVDPYTEMLDNE